MQHSTVEPVAGMGQAAERTHADTAKDMCGRMDLAVEVGAEDARLVNSWTEVVGMVFWMLEVAGLGHSEQNGSYQDLLVVDQAALVARKRMDSDGRECACLAPHDKVAVDCPGTARDERLASRFDAYRGPSVMLGHTSHDGT